jgi:hypothetical protein
VSFLGPRLPTDEHGRIIDSPAIPGKRRTAEPVQRRGPKTGVKVGDVYGQLTVLERVRPPDGTGFTLAALSWWRCRCAGGYVRLVASRDLRRGSATACQASNCRLCPRRPRDGSGRYWRP